MLSIFSLLEVLLSKDKWNALPEERKGIASATKFSQKLKELYIND